MDERILTPEDALRKIQKNWIEGSYRATKHAKEELKNANCDMNDVKQIIFNPKSVGKVKYDNTYKNWKVEISGIAVDGQELTIVLGFWEDEFIIITAY